MAFIELALVHRMAEYQHSTGNARNDVVRMRTATPVSPGTRNSVYDMPCGNIVQTSN